MWASAPVALVATRFLWPRESCCRCRADFSSASAALHAASRKKVVVVGSGWAGLASAHHLCKQGFEVTLLESGSSPAEEIGVKGFWRPYRNPFSAIDELGLQPFTKWTSSAIYSQEGMEKYVASFEVADNAFFSWCGRLCENNMRQRTRRELPR